ncbi:Uncharacterised protein [Porphyromonas macacae]|uniref:Uncharacterized protein n=1 Tax=Porphyromonas macacae TaxID=28115 RepID=A0A379DIL9_9PORP|nr:Uncharacterised protein [Porphyromonas macacae]
MVVEKTEIREVNGISKVVCNEFVITTLLVKYWAYN